MTARRDVLLSIAAAGLGACTPVWLLPREHSLSLDDIQRRLARRFPWKKSFLGLFELELVNPVAALDETKGRVASSFDVTLRTKLSSRVFAGKAILSGVPRYDERERSFFFAEPTIDQLDFDGLPRAFADQLRELAAVLAPDVTQGLALHTLRPEDTKIMGTEMTAKSIRVERDRLVVELAPFAKK
jgi:Protein of unknown function (DUF1439)